MTQPGDFSSAVQVYASVRREVPKEVLQYVLSFLPPNPSILDLGCGTGISTRQLGQFAAKIVGVDKYPVMIEEAKREGRETEYVVAPAETLPFSRQSFDAVTAFSAFHWFSNQEAADEIKRVLKVGGIFIAVNRYDRSNFRTEAIAMLKGYMAGKDAKVGKDTTKSMEKMGFQDIRDRKFPATENYSLAEGVDLIKSSSWWAMVPEGLKPEAEKKLKDILSAKEKDNTLVRDLDFMVVSGR